MTQPASGHILSLRINERSLITSTLCASLMRSLTWEHERVHLVREADSGLCAVIAIHSTALGPALGGLRIRHYEHDLPEALDDALRLSRAMTLKAATAGLDLGGGKAVVVDDGRSELRGSRLVALAQEIERLGGDYITAEDIGTTTADMDLIAEHTSYVVGRSRHGGVGGDPSPETARTVLGAIGAALSTLDGDEVLAGRTVGVIGVGKVGWPIVRSLLDAGARVIAFDPDTTASQRARAVGAELAESAGQLLGLELDVLSPCAVGGLIDDEVARQLRCRIVCGCANNQLATDETACVLAERGILYVPDFLANCGGLIHADAERRGAGPDEVTLRVADAKQRLRAVLLEARQTRQIPEIVAEEHAWARIEASRAPRAPIPR
jgi:glutamate dehydrogenase/leucine dehydrogenase